MERVSWRVLLSSHALSLGAYRRGRSKQSQPSLNAARCCQVIDCGGGRTGARNLGPVIRSLAPTKAPVASRPPSHTQTQTVRIRVMQRVACCLTQSALHAILECFRMSTETISANGPAAISGLPAQRRRWAAAAIFTALAMASLDTAIANIALPAIAADLHASPSEVIWVVNVYQIAMVATLLPLAALGEVVGHHRIYLAGLFLFTLASLACACAWSLPSLII